MSVQAVSRTRNALSWPRPPRALSSATTRPAVLLIDGAKVDDYPCYHKPCDTADKVNVAYLRTMIRLVATASGLLAVAEPGPAES